MKNIILDYVTYNLWANTRIIHLLEGNDAPVLDKEITSSFPSIRKTLYHIWGCEELWWRRLHGESLPRVPYMDYTGSFEEFSKQFLRNSEKFISLVKSKDDNYLMQMCRYSDTRGNQYFQQHLYMIHHCMNHTTFHRGQLVTMFRQAGITSIPATDFIVFLRETK